MLNASQAKHSPGRRQNWNSLDPDIREFVLLVVETVFKHLDSVGFVGAYLHGSLTMDSFYRPKSDIDILFVVKNCMPPSLRRIVANAICDLSDKRPITGDIETSILLQENTIEFTHPSPYQVHYGESLKESIRSNQFDFEKDNRDDDLAVYCTVIRRCGICLKGAPVEEVFGDVPLEYYRRSILDDLEWILDDRNILESPFYGVLNCCRVLALNAEGWNRTLNKEEGGEWALSRLPIHLQSVVSQALACYRSCSPVDSTQRRTDGHLWNENELLEFRDFVRENHG